MLTATGIVTERNTGTWKRLLVIGVGPNSYVLSLLISTSCLMLIQTVEFTAVVVFCFWSNFSWNFLIATGLTFVLMGFSGLLFGLLCSVMLTSVLEAFALSQTTTFPISLISGKAKL